MTFWLLVFIGGLFSGISSSIVRLPFFGIPYFNIWPGIFFGILFLIILVGLRIETKRLWGKAVFFIVSILAYNAAYWSAVWSTGALPRYCVGSFGPCDGAIYLGFFIGGVVGAIILLICAKLLFKIFTKGQIAILVIISGILGVLGFLLAPFLEMLSQRIGLADVSIQDFMGVFVVWQVGMILLMSYFILKNKTPKINP